MTARIKKMHELHSRSDKIETLLKNTVLTINRRMQLLDEQTAIKTEKMAWSDAMNDDEWLVHLAELAKGKQ